MKISDDHLYHGAGLLQIAEHPIFKAINPLIVSRQVSRSAYLINSDRSVYFKYASNPLPTYGEYVFTFTKDHLSDIEQIARVGHEVFLGLVCVKDRQICCISYKEFQALMAARRQSAGRRESQYTILVELPAGKQFRVYVSPAGKKKVKIGEFLVPRNAFPEKIFAK